MILILSRLCIAVFFCLSPLQMFAQQADDEESLNLFVSSLDTISDAERQLAAIVNYSYSKRFKKSIFPLTIKAQQIAQQSNEKELLAIGFEYTANYHQYNFNLDSAEWYYEQALLHVPLNLKAASIITAYGGLLSKQGNIPKAIEYSLKAKQIYENHEDLLSGPEEIKRTGQYGTLLNSIGNIYNKFEDFDLAISYYEQAQLQFLAINDTTSASIILSNKGELLNTNEQYSDALTDLLEAKKLKKQVGLSVKSVTMTDFNIANSYKGLREYSKADALYKQAIVNFESLDYDFGRAVSYTNFGELLLEQNEYQEAYENCKKGNDFALQAESLDIQEQSFECLYNTLKMLNRPTEALAMHEAFIIKRDSIKNEKNTKLITQMEMDYAFQKEEAKKELIAKDKAFKNTLIISSLTGIIFSLFLISYFIYRNLVQKRESETILSQKNGIISKALAEKDILLREIHHRVKNNLQVISSLLSLQTRYTDDPQIALAIKSGKDRVKAMTLIHQNLYQKENLTGIQVDDYFEKLIRSLFSSYNISPNRIQLETEIESINLDVDTAVPLGLIANELITNSLKYAFPNERNGSINVSLKQSADSLFLKIADDGIGMEVSDSGDGFGYELIDAFKEKLNATIDITNQNGTVVELWIRKFNRA